MNPPPNPHPLHPLHPLPPPPHPPHPPHPPPPPPKTLEMQKKHEAWCHLFIYLPGCLPVYLSIYLSITHEHTCRYACIHVDRLGYKDMQPHTCIYHIRHVTCSCNVAVLCVLLPVSAGNSRHARCCAEGGLRLPEIALAGRSKKIRL